MKSRDYLSHEIDGPKVTVILHGAKFQCTHCEKWKPASAFGMLNDTAGGVVRNQPQCRICRSRYGTG